MTQEIDPTKKMCSRRDNICMWSKKGWCNQASRETQLQRAQVGQCNMAVIADKPRNTIRTGRMVRQANGRWAFEDTGTQTT